MIGKQYIVTMIILMTVLGSFASLLFKLSTSESSGIKVLLNNKLYFGGFLYFISALLNILLLKYLPYSIVLPVTSLTYVWTIIIARLFLSERINILKVIGLILIVSGVFGLGAGL